MLQGESEENTLKHKISTIQHKMVHGWKKSRLITEVNPHHFDSSQNGIIMLDKLKPVPSENNWRFFPFI